MARWLTPEQTANHLDISVQTLAKWRLTRNGPPYFRYGRTIRYNIDQLDAWVREIEQVRWEVIDPEPTGGAPCAT